MEIAAAAAASARSRQVEARQSLNQTGECVRERAERDDTARQTLGRLRRRSRSASWRVGGDGGWGGVGCVCVDEQLTVVTGGSGVSRPRAVAGEGAPRLGAAAAVLAQVGETSAKENKIITIKFHISLNLLALLKCQTVSSAAPRRILNIKIPVMANKHKFNLYFFFFCNQAEEAEES